MMELSGLQALYDKYKNRDFTILGFPCNQVCLSKFQTISFISKGRPSLEGKNRSTMPELLNSALSITALLSLSWRNLKLTAITPTRFTSIWNHKSLVSSVLHASRYVRYNQSWIQLWRFLLLLAVQWNFEKFLIDKQGNVVNRWASTTTPQAIDAEIAKLLAAWLMTMVHGDEERRVRVYHCNYLTHLVYT